MTSFLLLNSSIHFKTKAETSDNSPGSYTNNPTGYIMDDP